MQFKWNHQDCAAQNKLSNLNSLVLPLLPPKTLIGQVMFSASWEQLRRVSVGKKLQENLCTFAELTVVQQTTGLAEKTKQKKSKNQTVSWLASLPVPYLVTTTCSGETHYNTYEMPVYLPSVALKWKNAVKNSQRQTQTNAAAMREGRQGQQQDHHRPLTVLQHIFSNTLFIQRRRRTFPNFFSPHFRFFFNSFYFFFSKSAAVLNWSLKN